MFGPAASSGSVLVLLTVLTVLDDICGGQFVSVMPEVCVLVSLFK